MEVGWFDGHPHPWVFVMLQYFETILPLVDSLWYTLQDGVNVMGCGAAESLWRHQDGRSLRFYSKLVKNAHTRRVEYDVINQFAAFCLHFIFFLPKKWKTWTLTTGHLWRLISWT